MITFKCEQCGIQRTIDKFNYTQSKHHFCSPKCQKKFQIGKNGAHWKGGLINIKCEVCGKENGIHKCQFIRSKHHFCSLKCKKKFKWAWIETICETCGKIVLKSTRDIETFKHHFCSFKCQKKFQIGENSPQWNGGPSNISEERVSSKYKDMAMNYKKQISFKCENCGKHENIHVHHIISVEKEPQYIYLHENLIGLCWDCHKSLHAKKEQLEKNMSYFIMQFENKILKLNEVLT